MLSTHGSLKPGNQQRAWVSSLQAAPLKGFPRGDKHERLRPCSHLGISATLVELLSVYARNLPFLWIGQFVRRQRSVCSQICSIAAVSHSSKLLAYGWALSLSVTYTHTHTHTHTRLMCFLGNLLLKLLFSALEDQLQGPLCSSSWSPLGIWWTGSWHSGSKTMWWTPFFFKSLSKSPLPRCNQPLSCSKECGYVCDWGVGASDRP